MKTVKSIKIPHFNTINIIANKNLMSTAYHITSKQKFYLCEPALKKHLENDWFDQKFWLNQGRLLGANPGRGSAWTIKSEHGKWVLKHYYRGGFFARINRDRYFWTGLNKTRAFKEFRILELLQKLGLPAPKPIAARAEKKALFYRTDLIISHIQHQFTFAGMIIEKQLTNRTWHLIGKTIARFHQHNIYHSDLNAHNILINKDNIYLIDFDKCKQLKQSGKWKMENIKRLKRSVDKISGLSTQETLRESWSKLLEGYNSL
ncbi:MAG: 3-deoxy-D-manno-octulosonic acid kinase [Proteobacteria bacterium]|nr:3-deoxy-D-manno-octulosonic acid kinase [Pseudomonadota bacterium]